jgi:O-antigen/teichoic acid export membrane protein
MKHSGLASRSVSAVLWGAGGGAIRTALQVVAQVALARLLGPTEYGVFALGTLVITFSLFFADFGMAYGLIQKANIDANDIRFVFTWQIIIGSIVTAAVVALAGPIAAFFNEPRARDVVRALAGLCLVNALAAPAMNLLKRELDYRTLQLSLIVSYFVGFVLVGIPMAVAGHGVWSLVAAWSVQAVLGAGIVYAQVRHPVVPLLWHAGARSQGRYGGLVLATNLMNWCLSNMDRALIGRWLPTRDLGLYSQTYNLLYSPSASLQGVIQPVFFAAASRAAEQGKDGGSRTGFLGLLAALTTFVLPIFAVAAVLSEPLVVTLYGPQWRDAAALCTPLALAMPMLLMLGICTPMLWTAGRPSDELRSQLPLALLWTIACAWAAQHGAVAVAWAVFVFFGLRLSIVASITMRRAGLAALELWQAARGGTALSLMMCVAAWSLDKALAGLPAPVRLAAGAAVAALSWLILVRWIPAIIGPDLRALQDKLLARLPAAFARRLGFLGSDRR